MPADLRYGQEEPGERLEILQQPLALGYLTSTARTGAMPRWWVSRLRQNKRINQMLTVCFLAGSGLQPLTSSPTLQSSSSPLSTSTVPTSPWGETTAWCLSPPVGEFTAWTVTTPRMSYGKLSSAELWDYYLYFIALQVRVGGLQRAVLAGAGPGHSGQELLPSHPRPGPDPALPRSGCSRLTLRISSLTILIVSRARHSTSVMRNFMKSFLSSGWNYGAAGGEICHRISPWPTVF